MEMLLLWLKQGEEERPESRTLHVGTMRAGHRVDMLERSGVLMGDCWECPESESGAGGLRCSEGLQVMLHRLDVSEKRRRICGVS